MCPTKDGARNRIVVIIEETATLFESGKENGSWIIVPARVCRPLYVNARQRAVDMPQNAI